MIAIVRVRGSARMSKDLKKTLEIMNLKHCNNLALLKESPGAKAMIQKVKDFTAFGEINAGTMELLLEKRARLAGEKRIDEKFLKAKKFSSKKELAQAIIAGKASLKELGIKKIFRLNAPRKGFERKGVKKQFSLGGALGYRGEKINELIQRMA